MCKLWGVGYYYTDSSPRSNAGGRGGVSKNVRVHQVADNVRTLHEGGEVYHPPTPLSEDASHTPAHGQT